MANTPMSTDRTDAVTPSTSEWIQSHALVTPPSRVIQVDRVQVSETQRSSVASALRAGKLAGGKK